jgi:hypothetical protein
MVSSFFPISKYLGTYTESRSTIRVLHIRIFTREVYMVITCLDIKYKRWNFPLCDVSFSVTEEQCAAPNTQETNKDTNDILEISVASLQGKNVTGFY